MDASDAEITWMRQDAIRCFSPVAPTAAAALNSIDILELQAVSFIVVVCNDAIAQGTEAISQWFIRLEETELTTHTYIKHTDNHLRVNQEYVQRASEHI